MVGLGDVIRPELAARLPLSIAEKIGNLTDKELEIKKVLTNDIPYIGIVVDPVNFDNARFETGIGRAKELLDNYSGRLKGYFQSQIDSRYERLKDALMYGQAM